MRQSVLVRNLVYTDHGAMKSPMLGLGGMAPPLSLVRGPGRSHGDGPLCRLLDHLVSIAVGKESEMSDLYESAGEHMQEEPADELDRLQGHLFKLIVVL